MCPGHPYMLGGGTSVRGVSRRGGPGATPPAAVRPHVAIALCAALTISPVAMRRSIFSRTSGGVDGAASCLNYGGVFHRQSEDGREPDDGSRLVRVAAPAGRRSEGVHSISREKPDTHLARRISEQCDLIASISGLSRNSFPLAAFRLETGCFFLREFTANMARCKVLVRRGPSCRICW